MKVSILTLGCRVNQSESNDIQALLEKLNVNIVDLNDKPDMCVINTCSVTSKGEFDSRSLIRKASLTGAKVIVTGCYSQMNPNDVRNIDNRIEIIDIAKKQEIAEAIVRDVPQTFRAGYRISRPYLKVQDGCNLSCAYCTVPLARGKSRSIPVQDIVKKAKLIESAGYHEIVLTGIHLGAFGYDLEEKYDLRRLLQRLLAETNIPRIRLSSLEMSEIDEAFLDIIDDRRICRHLHIPLQSGSNKVLKAMKRGYSADRFRRVIEMVAGRRGDFAIGTDVIAGFPGEDSADFEETYNLLRDLPFSYMHIFPFSPRPHTAAFFMKNRVTSHETRERVKALKSLHDFKKMEYMGKQISKVLDVIVEEIRHESSAIGTSGNYLKVKIPSHGIEKGSLVYVRTERVRNHILDAVVIEKR